MRKWIDIVETSGSYVPSDLPEYASAYMRGMGASGHEQAQRSEYDFDWRYEPSYPISNLNPEEDKVAFMKDEIEMWADEGQPNRYDREINKPIEEPIIVLEIDGVGHILDGWHRVGGCAISGRDTVPAVVGVLKSTSDD